MKLGLTRREVIDFSWSRSSQMRVAEDGQTVLESEQHNDILIRVEKLILEKDTTSSRNGEPRWARLYWDVPTEEEILEHRLSKMSRWQRWRYHRNKPKLPKAEVINGTAKV